jgi:predicted phosphoribosyltransferase
LWLFADRVEAGRRLASALARISSKGAIALAIPRGGVVVGFEVAQALVIPLDLIIPRKIGAPDNPELAIGAVAENGTIILDDRLVKYLQVSENYIRTESEKQKLEIKRRLRLYRGDAPYPNIKDREVIVLDDGVATGYTMKAALASVRKKGAKAVIIAVPVGPRSTIDELAKEADHVVCLYTPEPFYAIGQFYKNFPQTTDKEVIKLLNLSKQNLSLSPKK